MDLSLLVLELALIFLPGIVWAAMDQRYGPRREFSEFRFTLSVFLFGIASYAELSLLYLLAGGELTIPSLTQDIGIDFKPLVGQILLGLIVGFVSAIIWVGCSNQKLFVKLLQALRVTKRYGDEDVWEYMFNLRSPTSEYINLRDFDSQLTFAGYVAAFSEAGEVREILLEDVDVYNLSGDRLYNMPRIYLARNKADLHIEFPYRNARGVYDRE